MKEDCFRQGLFLLLATDSVGFFSLAEARLVRDGGRRRRGERKRDYVVGGGEGLEVSGAAATGKKNTCQW